MVDVHRMASLLVNVFHRDAPELYLSAEPSASYFGVLLNIADKRYSVTVAFEPSRKHLYTNTVYLRLCETILPGNTCTPRLYSDCIVLLQGH